MTRFLLLNQLGRKGGGGQVTYYLFEGMGGFHMRESGGDRCLDSKGLDISTDYSTNEHPHLLSTDQ